MSALRRHGQTFRGSRQNHHGGFWQQGGDEALVGGGLALEGSGLGSLKYE